MIKETVFYNPLTTSAMRQECSTVQPLKQTEMSTVSGETDYSLLVHDMSSWAEEPFRLLPRCMECNAVLTMRFLSVRLSVCLSVRPSVRPSVRLSNACIVTKQKKNLSGFLYHAKDHSVYFYEKKNGWWGATPSIWNFGLTGPRWSEIADCEPIIARSASAVRPSEKSSINTNRKSTTRFPMSLRWSSYVPPNSPKGGSKTQNGRFSPKIALRLKKVCY